MESKTFKLDFSARYKVSVPQRTRIVEMGILVAWRGGSQLEAVH